MQAVVFASQAFSPEPTSFRPTALMEICGVPAVQRVVELITEAGIREFDFILGEKPNEVRRFLGDGTRWGARFRFHLVRDAAHPYGVLPVLPFSPEEPVLIADSEHFPVLQAAELHRVVRDGRPRVFCSRQVVGVGDSDALLWARWAVVNAAWLSEIPENFTEGEFSERMMEYAFAEDCVTETESSIRISSPAELIAANRDAFAEGAAGRNPQPHTNVVANVTTLRNVSVHPTAYLIPPVYIGANSCVGPRSRIGPYASVGENCVVAGDTVVAHSVLLSRTFVGPGLMLSDTVVDGAQFSNARLGGDMIDPYRIMAGLFPDTPWGIFPWKAIPTAIAILMALAATPVLILLALANLVCRTGAAFGINTAWREKRLQSRPYLRHFVQELVPALPSIIRGRRELVGITEWSAEELVRTPAPWREFYSRFSGGVVTEQFVRFGPNPVFEERASADVYYAVRHTPASDSKLMAAYALRVGCDLLGYSAVNA
jgi:hypothetical protein